MAKVLRWLRDKLAAHGLLAGSRPRVSIFHDFHKPPYGGGNQFLLALCREFIRQGIPVDNNKITRRTFACIFNSFNFDVDRLRQQRRPNCRMIHRVDGPIDVYRGVDGGIDRRIHAINHDLADVTIFQSRYSLEKHREMGLEFKRPVVVHNAVAPNIFNSNGHIPFDRNRKIRLISTSWSDNPRKGGPVYKWLEDHLDRDRFEYTFVGRTQETFTRIRHIPPVPSKPLADILRQQDIYIIASRSDPCSNALIEALACGLPALYLDDGGHPELVGHGGLPFTTREKIIPQLEKLVENYELFQSLIVVPSIDSVARTYLEIARQVLEL